MLCTNCNAGYTLVIDGVHGNHFPAARSEAMKSLETHPKAPKRGTDDYELAVLEIEASPLLYETIAELQATFPGEQDVTVFIARAHREHKHNQKNGHQRAA